MNLVDRDLTEYQITQTTDIVTTARATGADKGNQTVHTRNMLTGAGQGESDCLITLWSKQVIFRSIFRSMQCESGLGESVERDHGVKSHG